MSKSLEEIRKKIDALDDQIHDLLMERADLIVDVSAEKRKSNTQIVQPAREAIMIRRLLKRHRAPLPEIVIIRIWRELVGAVSLMQTGLKVVVSAGEDHAYCWDMAKEYFGSVLPMSRSTSSLKAVSSVYDDVMSFAVLPWPQDGEKAPWWPFLITNPGNSLKVICALPYDSESLERSHQQGKAVVISKTDFLESGDDNSFLGIEIDSNVSRTKIMDSLKAVDLTPLSLYTLSDMSGITMHFTEVKGYVGNTSDVIGKLAAKFDGLHMRIRPLGGYPVLPVLKSLKVEPLATPPAGKPEEAA
ncbi:MAG: chorismate mutase [Alphaproteobacteria bacterium]